MSKLSQLKRISEKPWFYPVALLLIGFITYGYVIASLGYYWADWEIVMYTKLDPALRFRYYAHDRPFPWTYQLIYFLVGSKPIGWHIVTLLIRWAAVLIFAQALLLLWPRYKNQIYWLGALLLVYPGFLQQSQSATKARHIMTFLLFALSIYLMVLAVKRPKWARILFPLSWLATFTHLFTTEYFAGLELVRPVLLWLLLADEKEEIIQTFRRVAVKYLPYFLITVFYFWCRFIYFPIIFHTTSRISDMNVVLNRFHQSGTGALLGFLNQALSDLLYLTVQVWTNAIMNATGFTFQSKVAWFAFGIGILTAVVWAFFYDTKEESATNAPRPALIFLIGLFSFVLGAMPIWIIGKDVSSGGWADRFALAPLVGACLMVWALLLWFVRPWAQKFVLGFLLAFSVAAQIWVVNVYRNDWRMQLDYDWQLYWRAPALQSGTAIFSFEQPSPFVTHYSDAGFALNILYHYQSKDGSLPYWFFSRQYKFQYVPNDSANYTLRGLTFTGNTSNGLGIIHQTPTTCLRLVDPVYSGDPLFEDGHSVLLNVSNPARIISDSDPVPPDPDIFGPEPAHDWCYFFQKADLARQLKDWNTVIDLYKQSQKLGLAPQSGSEYIPLIEAYAQVGNWQKAYEVTRTAKKVNSGLKKLLCTNWARLSALPSADMKIVQQTKQSLSCSG
jgi:hypothetical protein